MTGDNDPNPDRAWTNAAAQRTRTESQAGKTRCNVVQHISPAKDESFVYAGIDLYRVQCVQKRRNVPSLTHKPRNTHHSQPQEISLMSDIYIKTLKLFFFFFFASFGKNELKSMLWGGENPARYFGRPLVATVKTCVPKLGRTLLSSSKFGR